MAQDSLVEAITTWWRATVPIEASMTIAVAALLYMIGASVRNRWSLEGAFEQAIDLPVQLVAVALAFVLSRVLRNVDGGPVGATYVVLAIIMAGIVDVSSVKARALYEGRHLRRASILIAVELVLAVAGIVFSIGLLP